MPDNHVKPTVEELEAQIAATQAELDKQVAEPETPEPSLPDPEPSVEAPEEVEPSEAIEEEVTEPEPEPSKEVPEEDLKTKYSESSKEARRLAEDEKRMNEAHHEANNLPDPTLDELKAAYKDWDLMSETEQQLATDSLTNKRKLDILGKAAEDRRVVEVWNEKVTEFIENPKTLNAVPLLEGKQEDFIAYATSKSNRGVNLDLLTKSFLYEQSLLKQHNKGKMFETGQGGDKKLDKPKSDKLTVEEGARLMTTNYNKYKEYLKAGKIATE